MEFMLLSRLIGDPTYENLARRAIRALWDRRHPGTGLVGEEGGIEWGRGGRGEIGGGRGRGRGRDRRRVRKEQEEGRR